MESPIAAVPEDPRDVEIDTLKGEVAALKDRLLRLAAEMENTRKRLEREKAEATLYAATNFAKDLLSVSDNMSRALAAVSPEVRASGDEVDRQICWLASRWSSANCSTRSSGTASVNWSPWARNSIPNMHQALFEVPTSEVPPGTVVQEMQSGFAIGERCLRPSLVGVAKKG